MRTRALALAVSTALSLSACSVHLSRGGSAAPEAGSPPSPVDNRVVLEQSDQAPPHSSVASMVDRVKDSVVNVRVTGIGSDVLGNTTEQKAEGSGVIIDPHGIIITNNHVVEGSTEVKVVLSSGDEVNGQVLGTDPEKDLAVIRADATDLSAITIGKSGDLRLGDDVIALGFPLGLGGLTVTKGIVSGLRRNITVGSGTGTAPEHLESVLQTDAAINPGNSGGALVNRAGQLVGINTAAASAGAAENIGFAISIDEAMPTIRQIIEEPPEKRAWLGVSIASIEVPGDAAAANIDVDPDVRGAGVVQVFDGSPAEAAGVEVGDVITAVDSTPVESGNDLTEALRDHDPGQTVTLALVSSRGERELDVELGERPVTLPD
jgi:S1-C subfamily serine protease